YTHNIPYIYSAFSGLATTYTHDIPCIYSAFSGLPATHTHDIPCIYSAFSGLPATHTHYIPYIYSAFSGLLLLTTTIYPVFTAPLVAFPTIDVLVGKIVAGNSPSESNCKGRRSIEMRGVAVACGAHVYYHLPPPFGPPHPLGQQNPATTANFTDTHFHK